MPCTFGAKSTYNCFTLFYIQLGKSWLSNREPCYAQAKKNWMNNIIIGNGIDIQFGGFEYTNKSIIERALLYLKTGVTLNVVPLNEID